MKLVEISFTEMIFLMQGRELLFVVCGDKIIAYESVWAWDDAADRLINNLPEKSIKAVIDKLRDSDII